MTEREILERIYDCSDRPANLPSTMPKQIHFAIVRESDGFVAAGLNIDIASEGDTPDEAEANFKEAVLLYYEVQSDLEKNRAMHEGFHVVRQADLVHA